MSSSAIVQAVGPTGVSGTNGATGATGPALNTAFPATPVIADGTTLASITTPFLSTTSTAFTVAGGVFVGTNAGFADGIYNAASFYGSIEMYVTVVVADAAAVGGEQVMLYAVDSLTKASADGYAIEFHDNGSAPVLYRIAAGVPTVVVPDAYSTIFNIAAGDQAGVRITRSAGNPVITVWKNGVQQASYTDTTPPAIGATPLFLGMEIGKSSTPITTDNWGGGTLDGPLGITGVSGATGTVTGPTGETGPPPGISTGVGGFTIFQLTSDVTMQNTLTDLTGLVFTFIATGTYSIDLFMRASSSATGTGFGMALDTSVAVDYVGLQFFHELAAAGTVSGGDSIADNAARGLSSGVQTANAVTVLRGHGVVDAAGNGGTAQLRGQAETANNVTFKAGSFMIVTRVA